jgi:hypothetical protein
MLEISEDQLAALNAVEDKNYVAGIRADIVRQYPALADDDTLTDRLNAAWAKARELGFVHDEPIHQFMELEANAPGFYDKPAVKALLRQRNVPAEVAFAMMLDTMRWKQRETQEKK